MTIHLLTIPDNPQAWPQWLTQRFCRGEVQPLVQELRLLGSGAETDNEDLDDILSSDRQQQVALQGLDILTTDELQHLFARPTSLLDLYGFLCLCGGPCWSELWLGTSDRSKTAEPTDFSAADRIWQRAVELKLVPTPQVLSSAATESRTAQQTDARRSNWRARVAILATAATLLAGIFVWRQNQSHFSGRVLGTPGLLASNVQTPAAWLKRVADAGNTWFDLRPRNAAELTILLKEVSHDCQLLIESPLPLLSAAPMPTGAPGDPVNQAEWFRVKCRKWKGEFDTTLAALESGKLDFQAARAEADKIMMKLVTVLQSGPPLVRLGDETLFQGHG
ncbi:MAG: hypothetical protein WCK86_10955 [Planctomycetia bacterium]